MLDTVISPGKNLPILAPALNGEICIHEFCVNDYGRYGDLTAFGCSKYHKFPPIMYDPPVYRRELYVVVCIDFHEVAILYVTVQPSDGKVRIKRQSFDGTGILE